MKVPVPGSRPLSILIVDDYPDTASSLAMVLDLEGFATRVALSGAQARSAAAREPPDVLIIEPRTIGCGWELEGWMPAMADKWRPLLVVYTSDATLSCRRAADAAGVGLYLVKPGDPRFLAEVLRNSEQAFGKDLPTALRAIRRQPIINDTTPCGSGVRAAM